MVQSKRAGGAEGIGESFVGGATTTTSSKRQAKSLMEQHAEILKNIMSQQIGKPTQVEAQRILKIMDALLQNMQVFVYLDQEFVQKCGDPQKYRLPRELFGQLSDRARELLAHQAELESKLRPLAQQLDPAQKTDAEGEQVDEQKKLQAETLFKEMQDNFMNLVRWLKDNPSDLDIIKHLRPNINSELADLVHCLQC